ncbi:MAG: pyridoxamine 5'-phosphate oxidase family protein [Myxococcales bacterium]|nr:pyridoxamine 5'-phosphate oxidase family protein [Myxococcales bacterium]
MSDKERAYHSDVAFSASVKQAQSERGSREVYEKAMQRRDWSNEVTEGLADFIAERDSFYLGTASVDGQPYIQHRGGPKGFLKVLDKHRLAFADYRGNRQYVSLGNLRENDKAFLFLMDYANRRRIKIWGRAAFVEDDPSLFLRVSDPDYEAIPERVLVFTIEAWDTNCPQHIPQRYTVEEFRQLREGL